MWHDNDFLNNGMITVLLALFFEVEVAAAACFKGVEVEEVWVLASLSDEDGGWEVADEECRPTGFVMVKLNGRVAKLVNMDLWSIWTWYCNCLGCRNVKRHALQRFLAPAVALEWLFMWARYWKWPVENPVQVLSLSMVNVSRHSGHNRKQLVLCCVEKWSISWLCTDVWYLQTRQR